MSLSVRTGNHIRLSQFPMAIVCQLKPSETVPTDKRLNKIRITSDAPVPRVRGRKMVENGMS